MPRPFLLRFASTLHQVQTNLSVTNSTVASPLAFTVKCAWNVTTALDPSDPCATARKWSVSVACSRIYLDARTRAFLL